MNGFFSQIDAGYFHLKKNYMLEAALKHLRATKIGRMMFPKEVCFCCKKNYNKEDFTMADNFEDFRVVGIGYSLFFKTLDLLK